MKNSSLFAVVNGDFVLNAEASLSISDLSIQRGYGIFDFLRTVNNTPVFLEDHLERFYYSASEMNLNVGLSSEQLKQLIYQLIEKNGIASSGIKIILTGGYSEDGYTLSSPNLVISQAAFTFNKELFEKGISLVTYPHQRQLPHIKTIDYLQAIRLQPFIKEHGAGDVLYHNEGLITECPRSNFFMVTKDDELVTPAKNILKGITRKKILEHGDFNALERDVPLTDITSAKEIFITSSTKNILPVLKIDAAVVGEGRPGKITTRINEFLFNLKER